MQRDGTYRVPVTSLSTRRVLYITPVTSLSTRRVLYITPNVQRASLHVCDVISIENFMQRMDVCSLLRLITENCGLILPTRCLPRLLFEKKKLTTDSAMKHRTTCSVVALAINESNDFIFGLQQSTAGHRPLQSHAI